MLLVGVDNLSTSARGKWRQAGGRKKYLEVDNSSRNVELRFIT
jgi:hypothetical protein